jgi:hypothetical protein
MAHLASASSIQLSNPFPLSSSKPLLRRPFILFTSRATEPQTPPSDSDPSKPETTGEDFEDHLNKLRRRSSGGAPGKKAQFRNRGKKNYKAASGTGSSLYLPPVPLKEAVSGGLKVELGFSKYSEKLNGRLAILGWAALLLVELATGKGVLNYHTPGTVIIQLYFVAAVTAIYVKFQKEKISVWPDSSSTD